MKTTVVVATRNSIATIERCLLSLLPYYEQGFVGEIIVVDGRSTDGTTSVLKKFPVQVFQDSGKGVYEALEIGWRKASCELIMFLDSDAYLNGELYPKLNELFNNPELGIMGCRASGIGNGVLQSTISQWWDFHGRLLKNNKEKPSRFRRLYYLVAGFGVNNQPNTSGPCFVVRRKCLQQVNGFARWLYLYDKYSRLLYPGDIFLSRSIVEEGWKTTWWTDSPIFHHPPETLKSLLKQRFDWGKGDGVLLRLSTKSYFKRVIPILSRLASPVLGIWLAIIFKNPVQIILFPLAHYSWVAGYIKGEKINE